MQHLKQKFNSVINRYPWALQTIMAISIALCAIGFTVSKGLAAELDWPWQEPYQPTDRDKVAMPYELVDIKVINRNPIKAYSYPTSFLVGDDLQIQWELKEKASNYADWFIDLYLLKTENNENKVNHLLYPVASRIAAGNLQYNWNPTIEGSSRASLPNPFDRHIYAVLYKDPLINGEGEEMDWNVTSAFNIVPWRIIQPVADSLANEDIVTIQWDTNLKGSGRLYLEVDKQVNTADCKIINGKSHCWIIKELPLEIKTASWKVGYKWKLEYFEDTDNPVNWIQMDNRLFGSAAHLYLTHFYDSYGNSLWDKGDPYYFGYDYNLTTIDQQQTFTIQGAPLLVGADPANPIVYTSPKLNIASTLPVASINSLIAAYNQPTGSNIKFYIGLFKADGVTPVYVSINGFDANGYYLIPEESEGQLNSPGVILPSLPNNNLLAEISSARFRIAMSSTDLNLYKPSVTSITLNYTSGTNPPSNITLNLTMPVEEISPETFTGSLVHPLFALRLYNSTTNAKIYENLNFPGTLNTDRTKYTKALTVTRATSPSSAYSVLPNGTYSVYIRSDRHLWSKFATDLTIDNAHDTYGITFPTLKVGNVDENNKINMVDFNKISPDYGKEAVNLLGDLNNDGKVNMQDLDWIIKNFALWGTQLPDEIRQ